MTIYSDIQEGKSMIKIVPSQIIKKSIRLTEIKDVIKGTINWVKGKVIARNR